MPKLQIALVWKADQTNAAALAAYSLRITAEHRIRQGLESPVHVHCKTTGILPRKGDGGSNRPEGFTREGRPLGGGIGRGQTLGSMPLRSLPRNECVACSRVFGADSVHAAFCSDATNFVPPVREITVQAVDEMGQSNSLKFVMPQGQCSLRFAIDHRFDPMLPDAIKS